MPQINVTTVTATATIKKTATATATLQFSMSPCRDIANGRILDLPDIRMKFNDMLKKKKKETTEAPEDLNELMEEIQDVNEARQNVELDNENEQQEQEAQPQAAAEPELSAEEKLKDQLVQANDKYLRLYAEFDNFRRRTAKERQELLQSGGKDVLAALLPVLDDFERALKAMETATDIIPVKEGVALIQNKLKHILTGKGVKEMETKGQVFDADIHEAITNIPAGDDLKGKVVDELEKGYYLNDKVLRFAKVVVGN